MPKNNQIKGKPKGRGPENKGKNSGTKRKDAVNRNNNPKNNGTKYNAKPGSRDRAVEINVEKARELYEKLNQMTEEERQERLEAIRNQLRKSEGLIYNLTMDSLELSEWSDEKSDEELKKELRKNYEEQIKIARASRSLKSEEKKIQLFPKVRQAIECVEDAKKEIEDEKNKNIKLFQTAIDEDMEEIEVAREKEKEIKDSIVEFSKALSILENAGGNSDIIEALKNNIREKEEELDAIDIEWAFEDIKNLEKTLESYHSGKTKYDVWISRCERPWEDIFADKDWEQIANMTAKDIHLTIANGVKKEEKDKDDKRQDGKGQNNPKDEKGPIHPEDQAENLRRRVQGQPQWVPAPVPPVVEHDDEEHDNEEHDNEEHDNEEHDNEEHDGEKQLDTKRGWFSRLKIWVTKIIEEREEIQKYDKEVKARNKAINQEIREKHNKKYIKEIEEAGKKTTKIKILWKKIGDGLHDGLQKFGDGLLGLQDLNDDILDFDDDGIEYSLDKEERKKEKNTILNAGPTTEGTKIPISKETRERAKTTAEGLARAIDTKIDISQQTFKQRKDEFSKGLQGLTQEEAQAAKTSESAENEHDIKVQSAEEIYNMAMQPGNDAELAQKYAEEKAKQEKENLDKTTGGKVSSETIRNFVREAQGAKIVNGRLVRPEPPKDSNAKGDTKTAPAAPSAPGGEGR